MSKPTCFIIMPLTTPEGSVDQYKGDKSHFIHVLDHLFKPAITAAGFEPIPPISKGSEVIHGDIIKKIETADLVLCDMSILNPNVFFELGIRTALNRSVAMVRDDATPKIPFDLNMINHSTYKCSLDPWDLKGEVEKLKTHLEDCMKNGAENALWGYFSMSKTAEVPKDAPVAEKQLNYLVMQMKSLTQGAGRMHNTRSIEGLVLALIDMQHLIGEDMPVFQHYFLNVRPHVKQICRDIGRNDLFKEFAESLRRYRRSPGVLPTVKMTGEIRSEK